MELAWPFFSAVVSDCLSQSARRRLYVDRARAATLSEDFHHMLTYIVAVNSGELRKLLKKGQAARVCALRVRKQSMALRSCTPWQASCGGWPFYSRLGFLAGAEAVNGLEKF